MFQFILKISKRNLIFLLMLVSVIAVSFSYFVEHILDIKPCMLCLYQRYIYFILGIITSFYFIKQELLKKISRFILFFSFLIMFCQFSVAIYNVGVERSIFKGLKACDTRNQEYTNIEELAKQLKSSKKKLAPCNAVSFTFAGFSLAELNAMFSLMILSLIFYKLFSLEKGKEENGKKFRT